MKINIIEYLKETVHKHPKRIAIIEEDQRITFDKLYNNALCVAIKILNDFDCINEPIAVYLPKSIMSITSDIGITMSGNTYMNLDIKTPSARIGNILKLIKPKLLITNNKLAECISTIDKSINLLILDDLPFKIYNTSGLIDQRLNEIIDTDPLCIINTSGSTGTPKGVVLNHRSFIDFIEWAIKTLKITDNEIIGSLSPLVFDIYSFELCMLMTRGSTIVILPDSLAPFPAKILNIMQVHRVNFIFWVPTIMVNIANMDLLSKISLPDLKTVWFAGEVFPTKQFNYWFRSLPTVKFVNLYGPIEITLDCTYFIIEQEPKEDEPIPIGFPCRNTDILILNEYNKITGIDEEGELCVRGSSLAMGYYNNPEKTATAFVQNPLNNSYPELIYRTGDIVYKNNRNEIIFKGRKDSLIKHMGYRIELGEIEHVIINTLKLVENGCVVYNHKKKEITLFYENSRNTNVSEMKKAISEIFPKYMIPTIYNRVDILPRNVNGKIDRLTLNNIVNNG